MIINNTTGSSTNYLNYILLQSYSLGLTHGIILGAGLYQYYDVEEIRYLPNKNLAHSLYITIENDDNGFLAKTPGLPLYGYGDNRDESVKMLLSEIETLYDDLNSNEQFSSEWDEIKKYLDNLISKI